MAKKAVDYVSFMNAVAKRRHPSALRALFDNFKTDESYSLMAGGLPNEDIFPIKGIKLTLEDDIEIEIPKEEVKTGLQYGNTSGYEDVLDFCTRLVKRLHNPPTWKTPDHPGTHRVIMTAGSQDGIYKTFEVLLEEGDAVLSEEYVYSNFLSVVEPLNVPILRVSIDKDGIVPDHLRAVLSAWSNPEKGQPSKGKIKALYCIPNGHNPSGARYTTERKRELYRLAQEYDFLIVEDDPYYCFEEKPRMDSFLSMDVDGRVIRLDSYSKTLGAGFRIGYVTAPEPIYKKVLCISMVSSQGSSHISQIILAQLVRNWGIDGFLQHCEKVYEFYKKRREYCNKIARKHLQGLAEWSIPSGGMFLWMKLPDGIDSYAFVFDQLVPRKVLMVSGSSFISGNNVKSSYVRVSFSKESDEKMEMGFAVMAEEIRKVLDQRNKA